MSVDLKSCRQFKFHRSGGKEFQGWEGKETEGPATHNNEAGRGDSQVDGRI